MSAAQNRGSERFLVYSRRAEALSKVRNAYILGPVFDTQAEAEEETERQKAQGWDSTWVGLDDKARWIVT